MCVALQEINLILKRCMNSTHIFPPMWENEVCMQTEIAMLLIKLKVRNNPDVQQ